MNKWRIIEAFALGGTALAVAACGNAAKNEPSPTVTPTKPFPTLGPVEAQGPHLATPEVIEVQYLSGILEHECAANKQLATSSVRIPILPGAQIAITADHQLNSYRAPDGAIIVNITDQPGDMPEGNGIWLQPQVGEPVLVQPIDMIENPEGILLNFSMRCNRHSLFSGVEPVKSSYSGPRGITV